MNRIYILWLIFLPLQAFSQGLIIDDNANVIINGDAHLLVQDGHFINNGHFIADASIVVLLGSSPSSNMKIAGDSITSFHQLVINKTINGVQLGANIEVNDSLKMVSGDLDMNGNGINLGSSGSIDGESNTNRIWGTSGGEIIYQAMLNAPNSLNPANMGIELTSSQNFGMTTIRRGHARKTSATGFGIHRYYNISPTNNSNLDATLVYHYYENELGGISESELGLWRYDGSVWENQGAILNTTNNTLTKTGIPAFSIWTAGSTINNPLPVELLFFRSDCSEIGNQLTWATASELNSDYFTIERSIDGKVWKPIGQITASQNSNEQIEYDFVDIEGAHHLYYYRLSQTDLDKSKEVFNVIQSNCLDKESDFSIKAFPNPAQESINLQVTSSSTQLINYAWYTSQGQLIEKGYCESNRLKQLPLSSFSSGMYILMIAQGKKLRTVKVMKR